MSSITDKEKQILNSHREILWIKRQIERYEQDQKTLTEAEQSTIPETATDAHVDQSIEDFKQHIDSIRTNLDMLSQFNRSKDALVQAVDNQYFTVEALYPEQSDHHNMETKKLTEEQIKARDDIVINVLQLLGQINKKKVELTRVQRGIIRQHELNRELTATVNELKRRNRKDNLNNDPESMALQKAINDKKDQMAVVRGVLNGIILESGIPWVEDERWFETMLRIGESLPLS